ncbi:glycoside hydrolase family 32 protein [Aquipuribacter nitratireducens]|uniref:beta-fructofuranosidase n=1 Tax=Aquipuribacter nitratireducens TaxID=650104 RepID=A0ABW0GI76_9MICO
MTLRGEGRPVLHATVREGWLNDPLGLTWLGGRYHLFLQNVPGRTDWAPGCHWAHLTSADLLHWQEGPVALAPGGGEDGCWSGCVVPGPRPEDATLFYTAVDVTDVHQGRVRVARPTDASWDGWTKGDVVAGVPDGYTAVAHRDPFVLRDGGVWRMLTGAGRPDGTATALVHTSTDLRTWVYDGELAARHTDERHPVWTGTVWECPQLFPLDGRWVLVVSVWEADVTHHVVWAVGDYADGRFEAASWGRLAYGPSYYATSTFTDQARRRCLVHWLRGVADRDGGGWAGAISLPHVVRLDGDRLVVEPHPAVTAARTTTHDVTAGDRTTIPALADLEWDLPTQGTAVLDLGGRARLDVVVGASVTLVTAEGSWQAPDPGDRLRVVVDGPTLEVFGADGLLAAPLPGLAPDTTLGVSVPAGRLTAHRLG